ncbi:SKP1-like protein 1A [Zingiber officinale]|uniref:SKP1-like protein 1A n=1 Tax=Zingiber officinale TaxID=94328 RepID=UPI001C4B63EE|nr:SKP1-like protein 1A [Zingiber officinale]
MAKMIKLVSSDGAEFEVEEEVAFQSKIIKDIVADADDVIPLPSVSSKVLIQVIEYCRKHAAVNSFPLSPSSSTAAAASSSSSISSKPVSDPALRAWDNEFVKLNNSSLFDIVIAANYLDIEELVDLVLETVADRIKGKQAQEIRRQFNIENDFTPEEEEALRRENSWAFQNN